MGRKPVTGPVDGAPAADGGACDAKVGKPAARLVPFVPAPAKRAPGSANGRIVIADDFDALLPAEVTDAFER